MSKYLRRLLILVVMLAAGCASNGAQVAPVTPPGLPIMLPTRVDLSRDMFQSELIRNNVEGCVVVSFYLSADAKVDYFKVLDSKPVGAFDDPAMVLIAKSKFAPGQKAGRYAQVVSFTNGEGSVDTVTASCIAAPTYDQLN